MSQNTTRRMSGGRRRSAAGSSSGGSRSSGAQSGVGDDEGPLATLSEQDESVSPLQEENTGSIKGTEGTWEAEAGIHWNQPFESESGDVGTTERRFQSIAPNDRRRNQSAIDMTSPAPAGQSSTVVRRSSVAIGILARRTSRAVVSFSQSMDPLRSRGNSLGLAINEIIPVASTAYSSWESFNARRYSRVSTGLPSAHTVTSSIRRSSTVAFMRPGMSEKPTDYIIQRLAKYDDIEQLPSWKRWVYRLSAPLIVASVASYWIYFVLRVLYTRSAEVQAGKTYWMAWAFIAVEIIVVIPMLLHRMWGLRATGLRMRPKLRIMGENVPSVDAVITCCGEDDDLVLDTAKAACNVDYPLSRFRVIICDDGKSDSLREKVERTAREQFDNLYYRSRPKYPGVPHHYKAGNLNYALEETRRLPQGPANFLAALDADMIPERDWIRALIPHMLIDPKCSMACPPQLFYNVPKDDPLCQSLDTFVHTSEPVKDAMGVAWCTGSGYIMHRDALQAIGGFPTGSLAEDVCCSSMLLGAGWHTAFVHEPLQFGTVPESLASHLKQRTRWTIGTVQTSFRLRFCLYGSLVRHMTVPQRLCGFVYTVSSLFTIFLVASMFTSPIVLVAHGNLVPFSSYSQLKWLIRSWFGSMVLNRMNEFVAYLPSGWLTGQREARAVMWMAIFHSIAITRTFLLPTWLGGKVAVFTSSGSQKAELNERDKAFRAPLWRRLKVTIWDCQCYLHLAFIFFTLAAVILSTYWCFVDNHTKTDKLIAILTHAAWPPIIWLTCGLSCWVPISYSIWPPNCPRREDLLERDQKTGVAYPKKWTKQTQAGWVT